MATVLPSFLQMLVFHFFWSYMALCFPYGPHFLYLSSVHGTCVCFHIFAIMHWNTHEYKRWLLWTDFIYFSYVLRSVLARLCGSIASIVLKEPPHYFPQRSHWLIFPLPVCKNTCFCVNIYFLSVCESKCSEIALHFSFEFFYLGDNVIETFMYLLTMCSLSLISDPSLLSLPSE